MAVELASCLGDMHEQLIPAKAKYIDHVAAFMRKSLSTYYAVANLISLSFQRRAGNGSNGKRIAKVG